MRADDPTGHALWTWVWPLPHAADFRAVTATERGAKTTATETAADIYGPQRRSDRRFQQADRAACVCPARRTVVLLTNGPRLAVGEATLTNIEQHAEGTDTVINAAYTGNMKPSAGAFGATAGCSWIMTTRSTARRTSSASALITPKRMSRR